MHRPVFWSLMLQYIHRVNDFMAADKAACSARIFSLFFNDSRIWVKRGEKDCATALQETLYGFSRRF